MRRTILLVIFNFSLFTFHSVFAQQYKVRSFSWERVEVTSQLDATPSEAAAAIVAPYKVRVDSIMAPVLGMSRVAMSKERPESLLGNWAADSPLLIWGCSMWAACATTCPRGLCGAVTSCSSRPSRTMWLC